MPLNQRELPPVGDDIVEVVLFADSSKESQEARRLLTEAGIDFSDISSSGYLVPIVDFGDIPFPGLDGGIERLISILTPSESPSKPADAK